MRYQTGRPHLPPLYSADAPFCERPPLSCVFFEADGKTLATTYQSTWYSTQHTAVYTLNAVKTSNEIRLMLSKR